MRRRLSRFRGRKEMIEYCQSHQLPIKATLNSPENVKALELVGSTEGLVRVEVRPNFKTLGPRYGQLMKQIQAMQSKMAAAQAALGK